MIIQCYFCEIDMDTDVDDIHTDPETGEDCCPICCPECSPEQQETTLEDFLISHPGSYVMTSERGYKVCHSLNDDCWIATRAGYEIRDMNLNRLMETVSGSINSFSKRRKK